MASIIYNVSPRRPAGQIGVHWLITLVESFRVKSKSDHTIRVSREKNAQWTTYVIRNTTTKKRILFYSKDKKIFASAQTLALPDVTQIKRPGYCDEIATGEFMINDLGLDQASDFLAREIETPTAYSEKEYDRIKVTNGIRKQNQNEFLGGEVVKFSFDAQANTMTFDLRSPSKHVTTTTVRGLFPDSLLSGGLVGRYVIIDNENDYVCIPFQAFRLFYQFV